MLYTKIKLKLLTLSFLFFIIYIKTRTRAGSSQEAPLHSTQVESASETPSLRKRFLTFHKLAQTSVRLCFSMVFFLFNFMHLIIIFLEQESSKFLNKEEILTSSVQTQMTKFIAALYSASLNMLNLHWAVRTRGWWLLNNHSSVHLHLF